MVLGVSNNIREGLLLRAQSSSSTFSGEAAYSQQPPSYAGLATTSNLKSARISRATSARPLAPASSTIPVFSAVLKPGAKDQTPG